MNKPQNYDAINVGWTPIKPGGHKCIIKKVEESVSSTGKEMLLVYFDMDKTDEQAGYFANQYLEDQKNGKKDIKWKGINYLVTDESTEYGTTNLKRFTTSVEESNSGFKIQWGEAFTACLKDKKVGIVFRQEEYTKQDGSLGTSVKPMRFCGYEKALDQPAPDKKVQKQPTYSQSTFAPSSDPFMASEGFMQVPDSLSDAGLPFN